MENLDYKWDTTRA